MKALNQEDPYETAEIREGSWNAERAVGEESLDREVFPPAAATL